VHIDIRPRTLNFRLRLPRLPDFNPSDFYLLGYLKPLLHSAAIENEQTHRQRIFFYSSQIICNRPGTFEKVRQSTKRRVLVCTDLGGGHFEHYFVICDVINDKNSTVIKLGTRTVNVLRQL